MTLQQKLDKAVELNRQLQASLSLQKDFPELLSNGSVKLMVQTKYMTRYHLPYKAWFKDLEENVVQVLTAEQFLRHTKQTFSEKDVRNIKLNWEE